jgi:hypothetical protein
MEINRFYLDAVLNAYEMGYRVGYHDGHGENFYSDDNCRHAWNRGYDAGIADFSYAQEAA